MPRKAERITRYGVELKLRKGWTLVATIHQRGHIRVQLHTPRKRLKTYLLEG